jgi:DNA-binding Xre family transcriptional regulator
MYTTEESQYLLEKYNGENVEELAKALNKTPKSIIGKLSKLGVYQKKEYLSKTGEKPITKLEIVATIASRLRCNPEDLIGLEKTPKSTLIKLESLL